MRHMLVCLSTSFTLAFYFGLRGQEIERSSLQKFKCPGFARGGGSFELIGTELCDLTALTCAGSSPFKSVHQPKYSWTSIFSLSFA